MKERIHIVDFSPEVEAIQSAALEELKALLPEADIKAIGSMAVPLPGKEEIDILIVSDAPDRDAEILASNGYRAGPVEKGVHYMKGERDGFEIDAQIVPPGHHAIEYHTSMLEKLRGDEALRNRYAAFKQSLDGLDPAEYKEKKGGWIRENLL